MGGGENSSGEDGKCKGPAEGAIPGLFSSSREARLAEAVSQGEGGWGAV